MIKKKIDKKDVLVGALVLILIVSCIFFYVQGKGEAEEEPPAIDVDELTEGDGYEDNAASIQYNDGLHRVKFEHIGFYEGFMFLNEVNFMTEENESFVLMRTTADMKPGDDIPEVYMVPVIKDSVMAVNIYLDDDFRDFMGDDTNIIWGSEYQNFKKYDFSVEYKPGIYVDTVYDHDTERFRVGGNDANVFVGDATQEDAQAMIIEGITGVFLK